MTRLKTAEQIDGIRESCRLLSQILKDLQRIVAPGISTRDIDSFVRSASKELGARPAFLGYQGYPAAVCVSVNDEVIHGIPGRRKLRSGDIVSIDCGLEYQGFFSDAALTLPVGQVSAEAETLMRVTRECLERAIEKAVFGARIKDLAAAVSGHAQKHGFGVVRDYCGHGVGLALHEEPQVPNYVGLGPNPRLKEGMVLAIEPMINAGGDEVEVLDDGWTVITADGRLSAHFEHTIAIFPDRTEVLTSW